MLFYCDSRLNVTEELNTQFAFDNERFEVENVCDALKNPQTGDIELLIRWKGFSEAENSWEPASIIIADAPTLVARYYTVNKNHPLASRIQTLLKA